MRSAEPNGRLLSRDHRRLSQARRNLGCDQLRQTTSALAPDPFLNAYRTYRWSIKQRDKFAENHLSAVEQSLVDQTPFRRDPQVETEGGICESHSSRGIEVFPRHAGGNRREGRER